MARINKSVKPVFTHEGAKASQVNPEEALRRSVMACMLWEDTFYEDGQSIADRIATLIPLISPEKVASLAIQARTDMKLRHMPLFIVREMARYPKYKAFVSLTLPQIVNRADELSEFLAIYWKDGKRPLSAQIKKGLATAFTKFNEYQLAKYDRKDAQVKLRDVLFLCHAKPENDAQAESWKKLIDGTLPIPETWENRLSAGEDKKAVWESLMTENELGGLALLRNLRNMIRDNVNPEIVFKALDNMKTERILPFRFISAARYAPQWESHIEKPMLKCLEGREKLKGKTALLVDVSGSMRSSISGKSDLSRIDAANGLAILVREMAENVDIFSFSDQLARIPDRHGFALRDAVDKSQPHSGTHLGSAVELLNRDVSYDRLIVLTDEQSADNVPAPKGKGYVINVAAYQNGIGYGSYTHISGWSEAVLDYIIESEK